MDGNMQGSAAGGQTAAQLAALIASGAVDPEALAERTLAAIAACDDQAIFITVTAARARAEARAAATRLREGRARGALDGVPIAWKDLFDLAGLPTTAGSRVLEGMEPAREDAPVVARLRDAGMVCVGRVNMTEFAYSGIGLNPHYGTPRNPHGAGGPYVPGGSSSGSAVAVARGLVPVAIGSDTGGSVRIPAAFNGVIGYKTSGGRYPMDGVFPLSRTLDTLGVFSRTVGDAVLVDAALRGAPAPGVRTGSLAGQRILVPGNIVFDDAQPAVVANFEAALGRLAAAGAVVQRLHLPVFDAVLALIARHGAIAAGEAFVLHKSRVEGPDAAAIDRRVLSRLRLGAAMTLADYVTLQQERRRLIAETTGLFAGGAVVAFPTVAHTAPRIADLEADDELFGRINARTLRNTMLGNFLDWCGIAVPSGADANGLPTSLLLSGAPGADDALLSLGLAAEPVIRGEAS
jgi:aspartyl-tRNA(Asn)/glutamyl-tRNA(Gln) amidotransferase subunit A